MSENKEVKKEKKAKSGASIEERLAQIEDISAKLQASETTLDKAVSLYEEGMKLAKELEKELSEYERRIELISEPYEEAE